MRYFVLFLQCKAPDMDNVLQAGIYIINGNKTCISR